MGYFLYQVDSLLRKAHKHAVEEMGRDFYRKNADGQYERGRAVGYAADGPNARRVNPDSGGRFDLGERVPRVKPGEDMGHDLAIVRAAQLSVEDMMKMFYAHEDNSAFRNEYQVFFLRAEIYMMYRGIPFAAWHQQATETYYYYERNMRESIIVYGPGPGIQTGTRKLTLIEESLRYAGIPLYEPATKRLVDDRYGFVWSPAAGKIDVSYVEGALSHAPISPGNTLFILQVWDKPSMSSGLYVVAKVGGEVGKVSVKRGQMVEKGDELMRIRSPWVSSSLSLPHGTQGE